MRNDTEGTTVITTFPDFDIGTVRGRRQNTTRILVVQMTPIVHKASPFTRLSRRNGFPNSVPWTGAQEGIYFGQLFQQLFLILLTETPGDNENLAPAFRLISTRLDNGVNRLLLSFFNKRTRIDDNNVGLRRIVGHAHVFILQNPQHDFRIY